MALHYRCGHSVTLHICLHSHEATEYPEHMGGVSGWSIAPLDGLGSLYWGLGHRGIDFSWNSVFMAVSTF